MDRSLDSPGIEREGWLAVGAGLALALVVSAVPFLGFVFSYFVILVHEMGHALAGWLYGYPSIPAFDFTYGGGVTSHTERMPGLAVLVQAGLLALCWIARHHRGVLAVAVAVCALYAATAWTALHHGVILAMGHGMELVIAGLFLHRALSGNACQTPAERPVYAFVGFFTVIHDLRFSWRLLTSEYQRELYANAKGGGHWMDFSRLAGEHFGTSLEIVAAVFVLLCGVPVAIALAANLGLTRGRGSP
jgi:hypothetical protein